jgi:hypothetical protein
MLALSKSGVIAWVWSVVMWTVSMLGGICVDMERSDVHSEQFGGRYSVCFERSVLDSEQVGGGRYSVGLERSDVGSEKVGGRYSVCIERSDVGSDQVVGRYILGMERSDLCSGQVGGAI